MNQWPEKRDYVKQLEQPDRHGAIERSRYDGREANLPKDERVGRALVDIGRFRTVAVRDLTHVTRDEIKEQERAGMLYRMTVAPNPEQPAFEIVTLSRRALEDRKRLSQEDQKMYAGSVARVSDIEHDVAIYRMFREESRELEAEGNSIRRVYLDYELKSKVLGELNQPQDYKSPQYIVRKHQLAEKYKLAIADGKLLFPDLRIEYEKPDQTRATVDLELTTSHYKSRQVAVKAAAGMKIYSMDRRSGSLIRGTVTHSKGPQREEFAIEL